MTSVTRRSGTSARRSSTPACASATASASPTTPPCRRERYGMGFRHNHHSLRIVERLERDGAGLNLTEQVRDGILRHTGPELPATLEGRIVRLVDRVSYINHDIDDALRAGVLRPEDLPADLIAALGETSSA